MSDAVIIKIDLSISPDEYIKRHLGKLSKETTDKIQEVIKEKKMVDGVKNALQEKNQARTNELNKLFIRIREAGETGVLKKEVCDTMYQIEAAKSASGVTLKLKAMVKSELVGYELKSNKDSYIIAPLDPVA